MPKVASKWYPKFSHLKDFDSANKRHHNIHDKIPMVPKMSNGTQDGTQVISKHPKTFYSIINLYHLKGQKMDHIPL